jgi:hypothetical protein
LMMRIVWVWKRWLPRLSRRPIFRHCVRTPFGGLYRAFLLQTPHQCWRLIILLIPKIVIPNPALSGEESAFS